MSYSILYFILWVILLAGSILAFVLTIVMNKPKRPKATAAVEPSMDEGSSEETPAAEEAVVDEGFGEVPFQAEAEVADDFAAFDNEFK